MNLRKNTKNMNMFFWKKKKWFKIKKKFRLIFFFFGIGTQFTTKKSSSPSVFFPAFLQTAVIDKPIPALFVGALQSATIGGL